MGFKCRELLISTAIACLSGCGKQPSVSQPAWTVWSSPSSTAVERLRAATNLVTLGATRRQVVETLGRTGRWSHWHGQAINAYYTNGPLTATPLPDYDYYTLEYAAPPAAAISLRFAKQVEESEDEWRLVSIGIRKLLSQTAAPTNP